jgi:hypothetical protein
LFSIEHLADTIQAEIANSLPFPLVDEEIYEPPRETEDGESIRASPMVILLTLTR